MGFVYNLLLFPTVRFWQLSPSVGWSTFLGHSVLWIMIQISIVTTFCVRFQFIYLVLVNNEFQIAIVLKTPPFRDQNIETPVLVYIYLQSPVLSERSDPTPFQYVPENPGIFLWHSRMAQLFISVKYFSSCVCNRFWLTLISILNILWTLRLLNYSIDQLIKIHFPSSDKDLQYNKCYSIWNSIRNALCSFKLCLNKKQQTFANSRARKHLRSDK